MTGCKDCAAEGITSKRPAPHPGPRCTTHNRLRRKAVSARAHALRTEKVYGITEEQYWALYAAQGGRCAICQRATGKTKRLSVDHEHNKEGCDHPPNQACVNCVRGLVDTTCNVIVLGRYSIEALARAINYLVDPPARKVLHATENRATG